MRAAASSLASVLLLGGSTFAAPGVAGTAGLPENVDLVDMDDDDLVGVEVLDDDGELNEDDDDHAMEGGHVGDADDPPSEDAAMEAHIQRIFEEYPPPTEPQKMALHEKFPNLMRKLANSDEDIYLVHLLQNVTATATEYDAFTEMNSVASLAGAAVSAMTRFEEDEALEIVCRKMMGVSKIASDALNQDTTGLEEFDITRVMKYAWSSLGRVSAVLMFAVGGFCPEDSEKAAALEVEGLLGGEDDAEGGAVVFDGEALEEL